MRFDPGHSEGARFLYPALAALLSIFAIAPLAYPGSFQTHTGLNTVYNLMDLHAHLGTIGWAPVFGRGFDFFRTDGLLPYACAEFFRLIGFSPLDAIKIIYALSFLLSALGMFACASRIWHQSAAGLLAAVVYLYFPYHLAVVYVRGALGEAAAWAIFPFALLALVELYRSANRSWQEHVPAVLTFMLLIWTQPGLALLFALFVALAFYIFFPRAPGHPRIEYAIGLGALVGLVLRLPTLIQNQAVATSYDFTSAFADPFQFFTASWGNALPKGNYLEQFPYQLGFGALGMAILAVALLFRSAHTARRPVLIAVTGSLLILVLMMPVAAPLWSLTDASVLVEYPFELLALTGLALALVAGAIFIADTPMVQVPMVAALTIIPILAVYAYLAPDFLDFAPQHPPLAIFNENEIALLDYTIVRPPGTFRHGATIQLDLEWQALRQVNHDYTIFVHVMDDDGKPWGGEDTKPQEGALPTTQWPVGRVISDTHSVQIELAGPPEGYHLEVGLYTAANGERAATETGATEIRIDENRE